MSYFGKFRTALKDSGFPNTSDAGIFFTNVRKNGTRRVKLWIPADGIFESSGRKQRALERELKKQYGDRYSHGFFTAGGLGYKSLHIILHPETQQKG
jgi:hypothetical protein